MLSPAPLCSIKTESHSAKPLHFHSSPKVLFKEDLRMPVPSRRVWTLIGEIVFQERYAPEQADF